MLIENSSEIVIYNLTIIYITPMIVWEKICRPKCEGGSGTSKIVDINAALLAELG